MDTKAERDAANRAKSRSALSGRRHRLGACRDGGIAGVLTVQAMLPDLNREIMAYPKVEFAFLNGVNSRIRAAYAGRPLSEVAVPRQVIANVTGGMPSFVVNVDESGRATHLSHEQGAWLRANRLAYNPKAQPDGPNAESEGLMRLLEELVPAHIDGGALEKR